MNHQKMLEKYAELIVKVGVNVQKGQRVVIRSNVESVELTRELTKKAYEVGAKYVHVKWSDEFVSRDTFLNVDVDVLTDIQEFIVDENKFFVDEGACFISITSPMPGVNKDVDGEKMMQAAIASQKKLAFLRTYTMANHGQWVVVGSPNKLWAKQVFPSLSEDEAMDKLWKKIFETSRVTLTNDPTKEWDEHNKRLASHNKILNDYNFKHLYFKNSLGTDLKVGLADDHLWAGGMDYTSKGLGFNPNIPTEESFTMPHKYVTEGKVVATKPLNYQGKLIEDFYLVFKDGKVVESYAKKENDTLINLLNTDEGSRYIGEIALIDENSPISKMNLLFYNTLYDENASCHMALGKAYPVNIVNGSKLSLDELKEKGYNDSMNHVDFMFGSPDLLVVGETHDGKKVEIMKDGLFVI